MVDELVATLQTVLKRITIVISLGYLLALTSAHGQTINLSDSLYRVLRNKPVFTAKLDSRNSFVTGNSARVYGIKAGVSFRKTLSIGLGYHFIGTDLKEMLIIDNQIVEGDIKMRYIAPYIEYSFYKKGPWEASVPVQFGVGRSFVRYSYKGKTTDIYSDNILLYEPAMSVEYKVFGLIGIGGGLGYRIMLKNNRQLDHQFTSPVYVLRLRIIFDELLKRGRWG